MQILEKIDIEGIEYTCVQLLQIDSKIIYKVSDLNGKNQKFVEEKEDKYKVITDENMLNKIRVLTIPKTDVVVNIKHIK